MKIDNFTSDTNKKNLTCSSVVKKIFGNSVELLPSVNELFELELAYLEFLSLTKEELLERSAYIKSADGEYSNHYLMYQRFPDSALNNRSNETPRRRDSGVSSGKNYYLYNPPNPLLQRGFKESPQQRLWGIENLIKLKTILKRASFQLAMQRMDYFHIEASSILN